MTGKKCYNCEKMIVQPISNKSGLCNSCYNQRKGDKKRKETAFKRRLKKAREFYGK